MIQLNVPAAHRTATNVDPLGRRRVGWAPNMTAGELYDATRGVWRLDPHRAGGEDYYLVTHAGVVRLAVKLFGIAPSVKGGFQFIGQPLSAGDRVHDRFVGQPAVVDTDDHGVRYFDLLARVPGQHPNYAHTN